MNYEPNFEAVRREDDSPAPWHVRKLDGTGELHLSDWDAVTLAYEIREGQLRVDDDWRIPPQRWDDHPHVREVSRAVYSVATPRNVPDFDRYAAELVAALADRGLAVVPIPKTAEGRAAARRGETVSPDEGRHLRTVASALGFASDQLRQYAERLDSDPIHEG